jgi:hypothetical protein
VKNDDLMTFTGKPLKNAAWKALAKQDQIACPTPRIANNDP